MNLIEIDNKRFNFSFHNNETKMELVFFINGVGETKQIWEPQLKILKEKNVCYFTFDYIGHGRSVILEEVNNSICCDNQEFLDYFEFKSFCADTLKVFDHIIDDYDQKVRVYIVAHSYGCMMALHLARERKKFVSKILLSAPGSPFPLLMDKPSNIISSWYDSILRETIIFWCKLPYFFSLFLVPFYHGFLKSLFFYTKQSNVDLAPLSVIRAILIGQKNENKDENFFHHINQPVMVLHGEYDKLISKCEDQYMVKVMQLEYFIKVMKQAKLREIKSAGHCMMIDNPDQFNEIMMKFFF